MTATVDEAAASAGKETVIEVRMEPFPVFVELVDIVTGPASQNWTFSNRKIIVDLSEKKTIATQVTKEEQMIFFRLSESEIKIIKSRENNQN